MGQKIPYNFNDHDRILARYLDRDPDTDEAADPGEVPREDPLLSVLQNYKSTAVFKEHAKMETVPAISAGGEIHTSKERQIRTGLRRSGVFRLHPVILRIAALLMVVLFLWLLFYVTGESQPELLAESESANVTWTFDDGSVVILRPHSRLYRTPDALAEHHYRIEGEGYFDLIPDANRAFYVDAGQARIQVSGTRFAVSTWGEGTRLLLKSGSVIFSHVDGSQQKKLTPGQMSIEEEGHISTPEPVNPEVWLGWISNELKLDRRPLSDILREIEHHFQIVVTTVPELQSERVSGTLLLDDSESVLNDLAVSLGATVEKSSPEHYHLIPKIGKR